MAAFLILVGIASGTVMFGLLTLRALGRSSWRDEVASYRLAFPRDLDPAAVITFVSSLSGLVAPRWRRPFAVRALAFEITADASGIQHRLVMPRPATDIVLTNLRAALPAVRVTEEDSLGGLDLQLGGELGLSHSARPLRTDNPAAVASAILAALQPLHTGERLAVQWIGRPVPPHSGAAGRSLGPQLASLLWPNQSPPRPDAAALKAARAKRATPTFWVTGRLGATAATPARRRQLLRRLTAAFHLANASDVHLRRRVWPSALTTRAMAARHVSLVPSGCHLNASELAMLAAFPLGRTPAPGLTLGSSRQLPPPADIPATGRVLARATFPGAQRPLALSVTDSLRHVHVLGPTGTGKSTLLLNLIVQDLEAGHGVVVIDPKDLVPDVLERVPRHRIDDVIVLDPADDERPVGLNLLAGGDAVPELVVDQVVSVFHQLYKAFWGPRSDDILRAALATLLHEPSVTLTEVPALLLDPSLRRRLVGRVDDPFLEQFWGWYEGLSDSERAQVIGPVLNKLRAVLLRRRIRNILGQADAPLDLDKVLAERKVLLVALPKGVLGEEAAALVGSLIVARLWQAATRRAALPAEQRHPVFIYIDEVQDFLHLPTSIGDVLAQARSLGLGLTLAHQHLAQLPTDLKAGVLANARSRVLFQLAADDARVMAKELGGAFDAGDLGALGPHEVVLTLAAGNRVTPPVTGVTLPPTPTAGTAERVRVTSRLRYGRDRRVVEGEIRARQASSGPSGPVGRQRRQP